MSTTAPPVARERLFTRPFALLILAELGYFTADGISIFALPLYVTGPVGSDRAGAGLAFGAFALAALVLRPWAGRLADTVGRRPLLLCGAVLSALALMATAWVDSLAAVVGLRLVLGVADAAFFVAAFAAVADIAPPGRMGEAMSYNSLGLYAGLTMGPVLGQVIVARAGITSVWYGAALVAGIAALLVLAVGETRSAGAGDEKPAALIHWPAVPIGMGFLAAVVGMAGFLTFASLRSEEIGLANPSLPLAAYGATVILCRIAFARLPDHVPQLRLASASLAILAAGLLLATFTAATAGLLVGAVVMGLGVALCTPAFFAAMFATAGPGQRGAAAGTASAFLVLGIGAGPLLLGVVAQAVGIPGAFAAAAGVVLLGMVWVLLLAGRQGRSAPAG